MLTSDERDEKVVAAKALSAEAEALENLVNGLRDTEMALAVIKLSSRAGAGISDAGCRVFASFYAGMSKDLRGLADRAEALAAGYNSLLREPATGDLTSEDGLRQLTLPLAENAEQAGRFEELCSW